MIYIGKLIRKEFELQPKAHTVLWLADRLNCNHTNVYNIFRRRAMDTQLLERICLILRYNFFRDLADEVDRRLNDTASTDEV